MSETRQQRWMPRCQCGHSWMDHQLHVQGLRCCFVNCICKKYVVDMMDALAEAWHQQQRQPSGLKPAVCKVCNGSGFVAEKRCIDDGYGEVDSCPACDERDDWRTEP